MLRANKSSKSETSLREKELVDLNNKLLDTKINRLINYHFSKTARFQFLSDSTSTPEDILQNHILDICEIAKKMRKKHASDEKVKDTIAALFEETINVIVNIESIWVQADEDLRECQALNEDSKRTKGKERIKESEDEASFSHVEASSSVSPVENREKNIIDRAITATNVAVDNYLKNTKMQRNNSYQMRRTFVNAISKFFRRILEIGEGILTEITLGNYKEKERIPASMKILGDKTNALANTLRHFQVNIGVGNLKR